MCRKLTGSTYIIKATVWLNTTSVSGLICTEYVFLYWGNELGTKIEENSRGYEGEYKEDRWKRMKDDIIESANDIVEAEK